MHQQQNLESDFDFFNSEDMVHVVYKKLQLSYKASFGSISSQDEKGFESQSSIMPVTHLVHHWYLMSSIENKGKQKKYWYCKELQSFTAEIYASTFPLAQMKQESCAYLALVPFYQELSFIAELEKRKCQKSELYAIQSENPKKVEEMLANTFSVYKLLDKGMTLTEISKMPKYSPGLFKGHKEHSASEPSPVPTSKL
ncbi:MAG: hypothetical protein WC627_10105 [Legionella sp.]|jgi:hypothetical protein